MEWLKKPIVAVLFAAFTVGASTGFMVFTFDDEAFDDPSAYAPGELPAYAHANHTLIGDWFSMVDIDDEITFDEDGTGTWMSVVDHFEWHPLSAEEAYLYVNGMRWWHVTVLSGEGMIYIDNLQAEAASYQYMRLQGSALATDDDDDDSARVTNDEIAGQIQLEIARLEEGYDDEIAIVSSIAIVAAPAIETFIPTPEVIYDTLGSENGMMQTYMYVEGVITGWSSELGFELMHLENDAGVILIGLNGPLANHTLRQYQAILAEGEHVRVYYLYLGFSDVTQTAIGEMIGYRFLAENAR